jgi:alpha-ketoglutarate-dependent taurine dioxygenase
MINISELVSASAVTARANESLPLMVVPKKPGLDAMSFAREAAPWIEEQLQLCGAVLFRGFGVDTASKFDDFSRCISADLRGFSEESSPRSNVFGSVYTSTDYPKQYPIQFHNEYSYSNEWPGKLYFCCIVPPTRGGATPIADSRRILVRISPTTRDRFIKKKVLYVRNFMQGVGVSWQKAFQTDDRATVERYCQSVGIELQWRTSDQLTTRQTGTATLVHPKTGEEVWFNHAFLFNVRALEPVALREYLLSQPEEDLSTHTYYGDGTPIEPETIEEIRTAYRHESRRFDWKKGDVLLIDNMLTAHAREPFAGERKIVVIMAERYSREEVGSLSA